MKGFFRRIFETNAYTIPASRRATHTYVIGQPGTGKSCAIESWVMQDISRGNGLGVIDPHGDLFNNLVCRVSMIPEVWERVIIIDPTNPKWAVGFNPLEAIAGLSQQRMALFLTDIIVNIWELDPAKSPRLIWLLANTFLALADLGLTLLDLPRFLLDRVFRESLLPLIGYKDVRLYFQQEFPRSQEGAHQWVTPVLNKIGALIFDPDIRPILAGEPSINFRDVMDQNLILLVNLPKGLIGEGPSALLGAFIVAHLQKAALSRTNVRHRSPFYLYLDEFQNYTTNNIQDILSESRKYALSLTLAHQYLDQLSSSMRHAVLNTAGTLICFRVGYQDAYRLVREIFPEPGFMSTSEISLKFERFANLPYLKLDQKEKPLGWEGLAHQLTSQAQRVFWCRHRGNSIPTKQRTIEMPDPVITREMKTHTNELLDESGHRHGRRKQQKREGNPSNGEDENPFWSS